MGGMRVLEWCVGRPTGWRVPSSWPSGAAASADQIALCSLQMRAIRTDPAFRWRRLLRHSRRVPVDGLLMARGIGHFSYRTGDEFEQRFGREPQGEEEPLKGGRFAMESYLEYQGEKLAKRFDPNSYISLSEAMNQHDVGRGRGGIGAALGSVRAEASVAGIRTDRLYPLAQQQEIARLLPGQPPVAVVESRPRPRRVLVGGRADRVHHPVRAGR